LNDIKAEDSELFMKILVSIKKIAAQKGIAETGYRVVMNWRESRWTGSPSFTFPPDRRKRFYLAARIGSGGK